MKTEKQISLAAAEFAERWKGRGYERGESQPFWIDLLSNVYGIETPSDGFITFEDHRMVDVKSKKAKMNNKKNKGGRNSKLDPATNRYSVNFSSEEDVRFLRMFDRSGMTSKSAFIKARIFGEPFHVVTFDKSQHEYFAKLSDFHAQFRMVGNNYNQTLKELKSHFSERRTVALVYKLEKYMMQLVQIMHKVVELTNRYENHRIGKDN